MTPAARLQAAIECLDLVIVAARGEGAAADTVVQRYFATRRHAGSKDRRAVRELVFACIRSIGDLPVIGRAAMIGHARAAQPELLDLFGAGGHGPSALAAEEAAALATPFPAWLLPALAVRFGPALAGADVLLARAPLTLRANIQRASVAALLAENPDWRAGTLSPWAIHLPADTVLTSHPAWQQGLVEVQDEASQLVALAVAPAAGELVIDLCAGAGGKTLALAAMAPDARILACDVSRDRLAQLGPRAARAGVVVEQRLLNPGHELAALADLIGQADRVLVDSPCSGSGTWRRNPESRWRLTPERLARLNALQDHVLDVAVPLLKPGGRLVYATCSVLPAEAEDRMAALAARHPQLQPAALCIPGHDPAVTDATLLPGLNGCDGFFIASRRNC